MGGREPHATERNSQGREAPARIDLALQRVGVAQRRSALTKYSPSQVVINTLVPTKSICSTASARRAECSTIAPHANRVASLSASNPGDGA